MKHLLQQFAAQYAYEEERISGKGDDLSSFHYPTVFLYVGNKAAEAIEPMVRMHEKKSVNNAGIMYVHIASEDGDKDSKLGSDFESRVQRLVLPVRTEERNDKALRKHIYHSVTQQTQPWFELNRVLRQVSRHIAEYGRSYASFDRIHLSVITRVEDPLNVFIPEITLLANSILSQSFKSVQMDLYALISERDQVDAFGYTSSLGVAFLRELDRMQRTDYSFSAPLHVTEDGISIPVTHASSPLFDLVYILSDKNERGISSPSDMRDNYDMICHIGLLKNRKQQESTFALNQNRYNNTSFKNNVMTESGRQGYVSAGISKIKRPNQSIALTVLYHFHRELIDRMERELHVNSTEKLAYFGIDPTSIDQLLTSILPDEEKIEDMSGIMSREMSYSQLKSLSLKEAEQSLFGEGCEAYFQANFVQEPTSAVDRLDIPALLLHAMAKQAPQQPHVGFMRLFQWTNPWVEHESILPVIRGLIRQRISEKDLVDAEIALLYQETVDQQTFKRMPFMDKHNVRSFIRYFFDKIYRKKLARLRLALEIACMKQIETALEQLHIVYQRQVQQVQELRQVLHEAALESIRTADDYIGQNILEFYERVTQSVMEELEAKRGQDIFFDERYMGNIASLLDQGNEAYVKRLIAVCRQHLLTTEPFQQTFEEELLQRANVTIAYENNNVLSKDELFKKLYHTLEEQAGIHIRLLDYTHEHRYEEKYFFGDSSSEFIRFALGADETTRIYKLGCVHEKRSSGVDKLNLMGGFHIEDLMYYRNGKVYYESYIQNGYEFHGVDVHLLSELR
ncbi:transcription initiation factor TFIID [Paenibacillus guangzhouensis]|uniref:transcription initiation factor TFIID n=1 Tax=Paenibacillus guangzhouensis TaxID=1473112 RepID=UPI001266CF3D|nr:transcription initiation factor TFIID [Paenibacillus guangzhouensis]